MRFICLSVMRGHEPSPALLWEDDTATPCIVALSLSPGLDIMEDRSVARRRQPSNATRVRVTRDDDPLLKAAATQQLHCTIRFICYNEMITLVLYCRINVIYSLFPVKRISNFNVKCARPLGFIIL